MHFTNAYKNMATGLNREFAHARIQRGTGGLDPPEKSFLCNTGPDPLKKSQSNQACVQCWAIIGSPAKLHLNDDPLIVVHVIGYLIN